MAKTCGRKDHREPWMECPYCRATSHYGFHLKGDGWTPKGSVSVGDLPPYDEVRDKKREEGLDAPDE